jgi:hypothetical protein
VYEEIGTVVITVHYSLMLEEREREREGERE